VLQALVDEAERVARGDQVERQRDEARLFLRG
jgi:hypothetical protein